MPSLIPQTIDSIAVLRRGERRIAVPGLKGSSPALFVAEMVRAGLDTPLVIAATQEAAEEFCRELTFFSRGDLYAALFPAWDAAPFSASSPHPDVTGARLDTLFRLQYGLPRITVMPVSAALQRVLPRKTLNDSSCYLLAGEEFERDDLLARLVGKALERLGGIAGGQIEVLLGGAVGRDAKRENTEYGQQQAAECPAR